MEKVFGNHSVRAVFLTRPNTVRRVILLGGKKSFLNKEYIELARQANIKPEILPWAKFIRATGLTKDEIALVFIDHRSIKAVLDTARTTRRREMNFIEVCRAVKAGTMVARKKWGPDTWVQRWEERMQTVTRYWDRDGTLFMEDIADPYVFRLDDGVADDWVIFECEEEGAK